MDNDALTSFKSYNKIQKKPQHIENSIALTKDDVGFNKKDTDINQFNADLMNCRLLNHKTSGKIQ